ncbi:uncharacterized protein BO97DRAFT_477258 [Aspergillus homomorphus CBS 101889]|uniref:FAR1 domain-containing protein n=1 Tax=Aspergillus homomorphus (strain CBS 101889) TaxID=1450537 RepID=A0A395I161_ASPHC|nr:hypothetical protein BO97DRAFT_477258 [Aspergillus homomorphus CBS 101889]RAL13419.1 hypothetical protein BO97DRAFT_477258 [Aspergillus homomorphus CBS 101889]
MMACFTLPSPPDPNAPSPDPATLLLPPPLEGWYVTMEEATQKTRDFAEAHGYRLVKKRSSKGRDTDQVRSLYLICDRGFVKPSVAKIRKPRQNPKRIGCPFDMSITWNQHFGLYQARVRNPAHNHGPREPEPSPEPAPESTLPFLSEEMPKRRRVGGEESATLGSGGDEEGEGEDEDGEEDEDEDAEGEEDGEQQQQQQQQQIKKPKPAPLVKPVKIRGLRDVAVKAYCEWQESYVQIAALKAEFRKARDLALENGMDLEQIHLDQDPGFFIENGVKRGIARRFVDDISEWARLFEELSGR